MAREKESRRSGMYRLSDEERTAVRAGMDAARRGEFVSEREMEAFYQMHHRPSSLRGANGSRECAPDDRLRDEAIYAFHSAERWIASRSRNDGDESTPPQSAVSPHRARTDRAD